MGCLTVEVLSAYDLPYSEAPQCVTLTSDFQSPVVTLKTGPPLARHKDRNSFRFSTPSTSTVGSIFDASGPGSAPSTAIVKGNAQAQSKTNVNSASLSQSTMQLVAPLPDLYKARITIRIIYANREPLETTYDLQQLRIHESKWLILNLAAPCALIGEGNSGVTETVTPTIRVKLILEGPYRPEVAAIVGIAQSWFAVVDALELRLQHFWIGLPIPALPGDLSRAMVLPAVPLIATILVASPVIAGVTMVVLPFLLPVVLLLITACAAFMLLGVVIFGSTRFGRDHFGTALAPVTDSLLSSRAGQALIYDTGPRPSPVSLAKQLLPTSMWGKLAVSLFIDLVGSSSYLLPLIGEGLDIAWAPIQTVLIMALYDTVTPNLKYVSFIEEILPFTDIVPTATIGFLCEFVPQVLLTVQQPTGTTSVTHHSVSRALAPSPGPISVDNESTPNKKLE